MTEPKSEIHRIEDVQTDETQVIASCVWTHQDICDALKDTNYLVTESNIQKVLNQIDADHLAAEMTQTGWDYIYGAIRRAESRLETTDKKDPPCLLHFVTIKDEDKTKTFVIDTIEEITNARMTLMIKQEHRKLQETKEYQKQPLKQKFCIICKNLRWRIQYGEVTSVLTLTEIETD